MISKNHITFTFISKYFTCLYLLFVITAMRKLQLKLFFVIEGIFKLFLIEGIFIVFAILLFLYLFFSKLPPFPLQNSRGEEQVLPPSPKGFQQHHPSPSEPFPLLCYLLLGATSTFFSIKKKDEQHR